MCLEERNDQTRTRATPFACALEITPDERVADCKRCTPAIGPAALACDTNNLAKLLRVDREDGDEAGQCLMKEQSRLSLLEPVEP